MNNIVKFMKKNKLLTVLLILLILFFVFCVRIVLAFTRDDQQAFYGNRLDGIEKVKINVDKTSKKIKSASENELKNVTVRTQGRVINIMLDITDGVSRDTAKSIGYKTLENFSDKEKKYYDIQVFVTKTGETEDKNQFPIIGYKHHKRDDIRWTKDR